METVFSNRNLAISLSLVAYVIDCIALNIQMPASRALVMEMCGKERQSLASNSLALFIALGNCSTYLIIGVIPDPFFYACIFVTVMTLPTLIAGKEDPQAFKSTKAKKFRKAESVRTEASPLLFTPPQQKCVSCESEVSQSDFPSSFHSPISPTTPNHSYQSISSCTDITPAHISEQSPSPSDSVSSTSSNEFTSSDSSLKNEAASMEEGSAFSSSDSSSASSELVTTSSSQSSLSSSLSPSPSSSSSVKHLLSVCINLFRHPSIITFTCAVFALSWFAFLPSIPIRLSFVAEVFYDKSDPGNNFFETAESSCEGNDNSSLHIYNDFSFSSSSSSSSSSFSSLKKYSETALSVKPLLYPHQMHSAFHSPSPSPSPASSTSSNLPFSSFKHTSLSHPQHPLLTQQPTLYDKGIQIASFAMIATSFLSALFSAAAPLFFRAIPVNICFASSLLLASAASFAFFFPPSSALSASRVWAVFLCYSLGFSLSFALLNSVCFLIIGEAVASSDEYGLYVGILNGFSVLGQILALGLSSLVQAVVAKAREKLHHSWVECGRTEEMKMELMGKWVVSKHPSQWYWLQCGAAFVFAGFFAFFLKRKKAAKSKNLRSGNSTDELNYSQDNISDGDKKYQQMETVVH
ncbi:uncharacterized protein MONOS_9361 [Monocercomonoides exilis]|uniref:uncharacterized protein n=1 Tax=Monocercomonoides exilis TaxID=2049356 RepID=UPI00355A365B|nr:hypothetical protein MONOS_9361 [Monocercomonoides exilis]|eukprot:MONOS_9361.1-p1 / transcript=MONOS_9361.1 / gene=MONOS_9361 / organism=Monocercomonoides_exilis_PA203 / gene_product=unspecified product / transcript_product=unspecified product / location=Mono_scaffold00384:9082-10989(-) / protein_length=636 / sequence_SO=supercontig / SO=protein_coding / is_pseudo=false